jgi:hypothetical protein
MNHTLIGTHKEHVGSQSYTHSNSIREHSRTECDRQIIRNAIPLGCDTMKNTSLFASFWAMPKGSRRRQIGSSVTLARGVIGDAEWRPLIAMYH